MSKLLVELVPSTSWGNNLRSQLRPKDWDTLRRESYASAGNLCEVCGGKGSKHPIECHERWAYDDKNHVQTLLGLESLCPKCHEVRHIGRAFAIGMGERAVGHLRKVNGWTLVEARAHVDAALQVHAERSRYVWTLDLAWLDAKGIRTKAENLT